MVASPSGEQALPHHSGVFENPYEPQTYDSQPSPRHHELTKTIFGASDSGNGSLTPTRRSINGRPTSGHLPLADISLTAQMHNHPEAKGIQSTIPRIRSLPRPVGGSDKLGTFSGGFVPRTLNVLSILMFLRFGFIFGQSGIIALMGMLIASYLINLITTLSISAIATNGTVHEGGAYYLISRSLGPGFGRSIGVVFYLGFVFNTSMNAVGLVDCVKQNFRELSGNWARWLPEGFWLDYLWATVIFVICTAVSLAGSGLSARCSNGLLVILLVATFSILFSALVLEPFRVRGLAIEYTGISAKTFMDNLLPKFTRHADGIQLH